MDYSPPDSCPWNFPDKNMKGGCHFLLQGIFPNLVSNPRLLCLLKASFLPLAPPGEPPENIIWLYNDGKGIEHWDFYLQEQESQNPSGLIRKFSCICEWKKCMNNFFKKIQMWLDPGAQMTLSGMVSYHHSVPLLFVLTPISQLSTTLWWKDRCQELPSS